MGRFSEKLKGSLVKTYAKERELKKIPLSFNNDIQIYLSSGAHSELIASIVKEFGPRFVPNGEVLYIGETGKKLNHFDKEKFKSLGLVFDKHGKFPDVILYSEKKNWLFLIEAVTSHGPVDPKRQNELHELFKGTNAGLVYVTAFPNKCTMSNYLSDLCWETEVWISNIPDHMIHFDGSRFLGPY
jgi:adenine-specific DNA-methyltransferase